MVDRILELMKEKNLTPSQFADEIGIQRSGMSHLISGRNNPSLEFIMKVLKRFPEVKADYLLYGISESSQTAKETPGNENEFIPKISPTLFDQPEIPESKTEPKPQRPVKRERTERKIEKIVVFYDDKTFREYEPE
ncbi:MAG: helix-turn-helix transcriptional regulator [Bacteroidetes bacterium]|nr:helix-turn-helix transcriptional regulator [Bacteroidota bacterium]